VRESVTAVHPNPFPNEPPFPFLHPPSFTAATVASGAPYGIRDGHCKRFCCWLLGVGFVFGGCADRQRIRTQVAAGLAVVADGTHHLSSEVAAHQHARGGSVVLQQASEESHGAEAVLFRLSFLQMGDYAWQQPELDLRVVNQRPALRLHKAGGGKERGGGGQRDAR
jgi:hypothetical protein